MPLYYDANVGIRSEVTFQLFNLPAVGANGFNGHRIHIGGDATEQKCRSDKMTRNQFPKGMSVPRNPNCPLHDEQDGFGTLVTLYHLLTCGNSSPRPDTQQLQQLSGGQVFEAEATNRFLLGSEFHRSTFEENTP